MNSKKSNYFSNLDIDPVGLAIIILAIGWTIARVIEALKQ